MVDRCEEGPSILMGLQLSQQHTEKSRSGSIYEMIVICWCLVHKHHMSPSKNDVHLRRVKVNAVQGCYASNEHLFMSTGMSPAHLCCRLWPFWLSLRRRRGCHAWPGSWVGCRLLSSSWTPWYLSLARCCCWQPRLWWALLAQMAYHFVLPRCFSSLLQLFGSGASCSGGTDHFPEWQNTWKTHTHTHTMYNIQIKLIAYV